MPLEKAELYSLDGDQYTFKFMFNPTEIDIKRQANVTENRGARTDDKGIPKVSFAHPNATVITINNIILDTYERDGENSDKRNVGNEIEKLTKTVKFIGSEGRNQGGEESSRTESGTRTGGGARTGGGGGGSERNNRPPIYIFGWGKINYMRCYVESVGYKLTMFLEDGTPVRAIASITLKEVDPTFGPSNPPADERRREIDTRW
jgi:hypothetical protein